MKTFGTRQEVFDGLARETRRGIVKDDLILKDGRVTLKPKTEGKPVVGTREDVVEGRADITRIGLGKSDIFSLNGKLVSMKEALHVLSPFQKMFGTREEVFKGIAEMTKGKLTKDDIALDSTTNEYIVIPRSSADRAKSVEMVKVFKRAYAENVMINQQKKIDEHAKLLEREQRRLEEFDRINEQAHKVEKYTTLEHAFAKRMGSSPVLPTSTTQSEHYPLGAKTLNGFISALLMNSIFREILADGLGLYDTYVSEEEVDQSIFDMITDLNKDMKDRSKSLGVKVTDQDVAYAVYYVVIVNNKELIKRLLSPDGAYPQYYTVLGYAKVGRVMDEDGV